MSKRGSGAPLQKDAPWRAASGASSIPKIHHPPLIRIPQNAYSDYALSVVKHPDPIGGGLGMEAVVEAAGPDCIVPGQTVPIRLLGLKVWPIEMDLKFMEPVGQQLKSIGKFMDSAVDLMNKSFIDR
ncbi:unnamed protein product [Cuscuta campestris]|uniref:Uncharacterized protein n=1 Tax=Cuscuta campestris TaxID=132261 RepID=A0A484LF24_9ASTE|nr:unnamed protein product [Cuscuta campestris]